LQANTLAGQQYQVLLGDFQLLRGSKRQAEAEPAEQGDQAHLHLHPPESQTDAVPRTVAKTQEGSGMSLLAGSRSKPLRSKLIGFQVDLGIVVDGQHRNVDNGALLQDDGFAIAVVAVGNLVILGGQAGE